MIFELMDELGGKLIVDGTDDMEKSGLGTVTARLVECWSGLPLRVTVEFVEIV